MNFSYWTAATVVPILLLLLISSIQVANSEEFKDHPDYSTDVRWQFLTKANYSSAIRSHPHILLLVTVPWCGESRSLMKELATAVSGQQDQLAALKLMFLYRNTERVLAHTLGASEGIGVIYFHHSQSYKYGGRLRVLNILSSVEYAMSLLSKGEPLKPLNTPEELRDFLDTTDKALLLLEFCGWTSKLLTKGLNEEANATHLREKRQQKVDGDGYDQMSCKVNNMLGGVPWLTEFSLMNDSFSPEVGSTLVGDSLRCSPDELQHFESFFFKFMNIVREFLLPPERVQFGLISERALLSQLNIESNDTWLMTLHYSGCPSCFKLLTENDDLKIVLQTQEGVTGELGDYVHDFLPTLPTNKPSVLLFIDRSSNSADIRTQSKDLLQDFRKLALHYKILNQTHGFENTLQLSKSSKSTYNDLGTPLDPRLSQLLPESFRLVLNEGKQITLEKLVSEGSSFHETLTYLLQQKKGIKLSSLVKDAGFQLLSEDFEIKTTQALSSKTKEVSNQDLDLSDNILEGTSTSDDEEKFVKSGSSNSVTDKDLKSADNAPPHEVNKKVLILSAKLSDKSSHFHSNEHLDSAQGFSEDGKPEEEILTGTDMQKGQKFFNGSFLFSDGNMRILRTLTGRSKIPSVVIIDPIALQHYIIPDNDALNYSSLSNFIDQFLNGSLTPYQESESIVQISREIPTPPFVNLDFHEADSLPRVTANMFNELVLGNKFDSENSGNSWNKDVLVLFSNGWCGFCQRMELIVREVYRTIKSYTVMLKSGEGNDSILSRKDNTKNSILKVPQIYMMDCTLNDCSFILKTEVKREVYPSLILFPALKKEAVIYEGDLSVSDILNFLADHGILVHEKGVIWHAVEHNTETTNHEVLLKDRKQELDAKHNQIQIQSVIGSYETTMAEVVVGSFLTATNKLLDAYPFDESKVLVVKVDQGKVIEGLIINKLIKWDSLEQLDESLELLKDAPLSLGGPVMIREMPLVTLSDKHTKEDDIEVLPGVYFLDQQATLQLVEELRSGNQSIHGFWFFVGFSSWDWDQLFNEISIGAWQVSEGNNISQLDWPQRLANPIV